MLGVSAALSTFIAGAASHQVESQLQSSGAVYDRLWQQRQRELQSAAQLLARDFGFRAAVATRATSAPLHSLRTLVDAVRSRERDTAGDGARRGGTAVRGSLQQALAFIPKALARPDRLAAWLGKNPQYRLAKPYSIE
jgi:hypothetical protein